MELLIWRSASSLEAAPMWVSPTQMSSQNITIRVHVLKFMGPNKRTSYRENLKKLLRKVERVPWDPKSTFYKFGNFL